MVELYTKRDFRCDCGTMKILAVKCRLDSLKLEQNDMNKYNQNFSGVYCFCHRPYPDPEDPIDDEMIQCIICEDWYHCRHLESKVPNVNDFSEMVCGTCMREKDFLYNYTRFSVLADVEPADETSDEKMVSDDTSDELLNNTTDDIEKESDKKEDTEAELEAEAEDQPKETAVQEKKPAEENDKVDEQLTDEINQCIMDIIEINKSNGEQTSEENETVGDGPPLKKQKLNDVSDKVIPNTSVIVATSSAVNDKSTNDNAPKCRKPPAGKEKLKGATFWRHDWRFKLCDCTECVKMMKDLKVEFLLDQEDTVLCYQEKGMAKGKNSDYERGIRALSNMGHAQQIDVIMGYNNLKDKLGEFLSAFVTSQQVVTVEDVNRFFRMMKDKNNPS